MIELTAGLYQVAKEGDQSACEIVVGKQFMDELAGALRGHRCNVSALGQAGPPVTQGQFGLHEHAAETNDLLGWIPPAKPDDISRPSGPRVGVLITDKNGNLAVLFDPAESFRAVNAFRSKDAHSVWESACQSGWQLTDADGDWTIKKTGGGAGWKQRVMQGGIRLEGVAVPLWKLLGFDGPENPTD